MSIREDMDSLKGIYIMHLLWKERPKMGKSPKEKMEPSLSIMSEKSHKNGSGSIKEPSIRLFKMR